MQETFQTIEVKLTFFSSIYNIFSAILKRKSNYKNFCKEANIDYPPKMAAYKYSIPDVYTLSNDYLNELKNKFAKREARQYEIYYRIQSNLENIISEKELKLNYEEEKAKKIEKEIRETEKLISQHEKPTNKSEAMIKITAQNKLRLQRSSLENQRKVIESIKSEIENKKAKVENNKKTLLIQKSIIDKAVDYYSKRYVILTTRKIRKKFSNLKIAYYSTEEI